MPQTKKTPVPLLPCGHQTIQPCWLCCPTGTPNLLLSGRSLLPHTKVDRRLQFFLFCWCQEASFPTEHGGLALPTVSDISRLFIPPSKNGNTRFPTEGRKGITCHSAGITRRPVSPKYTEAQHFTLHLPIGQPHLSHLKAAIPALPLSGNPLLCCYPAPHCSQRFSIPHCDCRKPLCPHQRAGTLAPRLRGGKK
jgi:hypothetical protein